MKKGQKRSEETKKKISESHKGKKLTKEHIEKLCEKIVQLDLNNNYIKTWNSAREASTILNIHRGNISSVITNNKKSAGGFKWVKEKNYNNLGNLKIEGIGSASYFK
jgi:hypothetical protein